VKHKPLVLSSCALAALTAGACLVFAEQEMPPMPEPATSPDFEKIKSLAGTWEGTATHHDGEPEPATFIYRVTAGGTAVVETEFAGTEHEMVTVYHMVGDELVLTHYCMLANQPTMAVQPDDDPDVMRFEFTGGTNITSENDWHMHAVDMTFHDEDAFTARWTSHMDGQPGPSAVVELQRKKD
jgi:hypothetical protein